MRMSESSSDPLGGKPSVIKSSLMDSQFLAEAADDLGLWGISSIEHHFHSEGYEVGPSPGIIATHLAGRRCDLEESSRSDSGLRSLGSRAGGAFGW